MTTVKQLEKRKAREADTDGIQASLEMLRTAVVTLGRATLEEVADCLEDVNRYLEMAQSSLSEYVELADYQPNYPALAGGCERLRDSVKLGLHDEPKSVPEFALALDDLLRDTDAI